MIDRHSGLINKGFYLFHFSLFALCIFLILSGAERSQWMNYETAVSFRALQVSIRPYLIGFLVSGIGIAVGVLMFTYPAFKSLYAHFVGSEPSSSDDMRVRESKESVSV